MCNNYINSPISDLSNFNSISSNLAIFTRKSQNLPTCSNKVKESIDLSTITPKNLQQITAQLIKDQKSVQEIGLLTISKKKSEYKTEIIGRFTVISKTTSKYKTEIIGRFTITSEIDTKCKSKIIGRFTITSEPDGNCKNRINQ